VITQDAAPLKSASARTAPHLGRVRDTASDASVRDAHALTAYRFAAQARSTTASTHHTPHLAARFQQRPGDNCHEGTLCPAMTADRSDLYADLGLTSRATQEQIRHAYRTLVRHNHPDTRPFGEPADSAVSDTTLQQVISAYSVLGDPARRALYDHRITSTRAATPIPIHTAPRFQQASPDQPPILAGPVRWHFSR
jgi:hypothetical protein